MKGSCKLGLCLLAIILALPLGSAVAQDGPAGRKVLKNPKPAYPALARTMNLSGTVRLEAIVAPNGSVKAVDIKGGNPLLAQAAQFTVREWKWEKAEHETTELLEIRFTP
ncbi:MAG TPA: energy transducer TonB [Terriglobales bacterium]|jgi:TonB family protein|nr:energy transducer TonB [Terriglobales bacterium]